MKLSTLTMIHDLLRCEVDALNASWGAARDVVRARERARDEAAALDGIGSLAAASEFEKAEKEADKIHWQLIDARKALEDFETHDWN